MNALEQARFNMVEQQIRPWQVLDPAVLHTLQHIARELFVPAKHQALAYTDTEISLGHGQEMLPPRVDARLLHDVQLKPTDKVLEIGTGSGYRLCSRPLVSPRNPKKPWGGSTKLPRPQHTEN